MRRLTTIIWHMLKYQQPYVSGGPPRQKLPQNPVPPGPTASDPHPADRS